MVRNVGRFELRNCQGIPIANPVGNALQLLDKCIIGVIAGNNRRSSWRPTWLATIYQHPLFLLVQVNGKSLSTVPYGLKTGDKVVVRLDGSCDGNVIGRSEAN